MKTNSDIISIDHSIESGLIKKSWERYVKDSSKDSDPVIDFESLSEKEKALVKSGFSAGWWYCLEKKLNKSR